MFAILTEKVGEHPARRVRKQPVELPRSGKAAGGGDRRTTRLFMRGRNTKPPATDSVRVERLELEKKTCV